MQGKIIKGIAGFYYVDTGTAGIYECKAKGIFRKEKKKPLVGDLVEIEILDEAEKTGNLVQIAPRKNELIRPAVANIDQALVYFALKSPDPDGLLIDRFLVMMKRQEVPVIICFNKVDLVDEAETEHWKAVYESCGYEVLTISAGNREGTEAVEQVLRGKTTVVAGPSGAGKSTLTNLMQKEVVMETGDISRKLGRGKNTTRHAQLVPLGADTYFCDTPGFTSLDIPAMEPVELQQYFPDFADYEKQCRFQGCSHIHEPECGIKQAVQDGLIYPERYENYCRIYEELQEMKRRKY